MKMKFESPELTVVRFDTTDVIATSGPASDGGEGYTANFRNSSLKKAGVSVSMRSSVGFQDLCE